MAQSTVQSAILRIGSRGSPLALAQTNTVRAVVAAAHGIDPARIAVEVIRTTGDRIQDRPLAEAGGKALFTKEIEEALLDGRIDLAVHSAKDMPTVLPDGLVLTAVLPREDVRDVFISRKVKTLRDLPPGATVGTASLRRQAMVKRARPDLTVISFRGNVETRLRKIEEGQADATLLALAGLRRLGLAQVATSVIEIDEFLPAVGQGVVCIETRADDTRTRDLLAAIDHHDTGTALMAERAYLAVLDGSCRTPIGGYAVLAGDRLSFRGVILKPDGSAAFETSLDGARKDAVEIGKEAGRILKDRAGPGFF